MKIHVLLAVLVAGGCHVSAFASDSDGSTDPTNHGHPKISNYIYVSGSGYSLNVKPYHWQSTPPAGATQWVTNDVNETNIDARMAPVQSVAGKFLAGTGGFYKSIPPATTRTELWHPVNEPLRDGRVAFAVNFALIASGSNRVSDNFGWAFKGDSGSVLFQILFQPVSKDPKLGLDIWVYDLNGVGKNTNLTIHYGEKYKFAIDIDHASRSYNASISSRSSSRKFSGNLKNAHGKRRFTADKDGPLPKAPPSTDDNDDPFPVITSVAAVWSLNSDAPSSYGDNYMLFDNYTVIPEIGGRVLGPGIPEKRSFLIPDPIPLPVTSH